MKCTLFFALTLPLVAFARPQPRAPFTLQNGKDAIALNNKFKGLNEGSPCQNGEDACVKGKFAQCVNGKFLATPCAPGTTCAALPLVNKPGTSIACTTQADIDARIAATGAKDDPSQPSTPPQGTKEKGKGGQGEVDPQTSLTLDPAVIAKGFANDGQDPPTPGQVPSLTSKNNFINFCLTAKGLPITDGKQIKTGSCNPAPIGIIPSVDNMPSAKFVFPKNNDVVQANKPFDIKLAINKFASGNFVNAQKNYFAAPQQVTEQGQIIGHSHVVVERMTGIDQTTPPDPNVFAFFKGLNDKAVNGILTATVANGLPAGTYRVSSITTAANHQPVIVAVAQHGSIDDAVYFTVKDKGAGKGGKA